MARVELMAPAGSPEALKAAVGNGADAVYLGGKQFNAREGAENFSRQEILAAIDYAHERGTRVYVTVNILLADRELAEALEYLYFLGKARVDGIIVQDLGLAVLARRLLPELPLIGSTQMTVTSAAGAKFLQEQGFRRVVLGRELSLADIRAISRQVDIELEAFVHGALCFSYSGQCLLSSMVGGRSGNRGRCAQPCRLAYTLVDERGRPLELKPEHLLSTRDLYTLDRVPQLIAAGVKAFKIEGRMRRPEYVAVVTRAYRRVIDRYLADPGGFQVLPEEERAVAQIFNRDFTPGYLERDPGVELMSYGRPSNRGLYLGRAARRQGERFLVHLEAPLRQGDGLEVWVSRGGHQGLVVRHIWQGGREVTFAPAGTTVALELPPSTRPGDRIFKTSDVELLKEVRRTYTSPREERRLPLAMKVAARPGEPLKLEVIDPQGHRVQARTAIAAAAAERHPLDEAVLAEHLGRLGNTPYRLAELITSLAGPVMVPLSELNRARREAIEKLRQVRLAIFPQRVPPAAEFEEGLEQLLPRQGRGRPGAGLETGKGRGPWNEGTAGPGRQDLRGVPRLAVAVGDLEGARAALAAGAGRVYLAGETWQDREPPDPAALQELMAAAGEKGAAVIPALPRIWHETEAAAVARQLERLAATGASLFLIAGLGGLQILKEYGLGGWGDYPLNAFNTWSLKALAVAGLAGVTLSTEMNLEQLRELDPPLPVEAIVHGALPLMVSAHCVLGARLGGKRPGRACTAPCRRGRYGLKDRLGLVFPVTTDRQCRFYLYNAREMSLIDHLEEIAALGLDWVRIEAREKAPGYIRRVTGLYREALAALENGDAGEILAALAGEAEALAPAGITRGHYFRGVV
ncbi:Peptidase family U32 [Neomoorella glycerini]|uniref:Peptidase family U32 n=1 Tax=Neomoorella glycerini TaxID=55779 RepID=A0A6I5ZMF5_9FIRM|nr:U32 family peptidase [Moorella glycerini]QGP90795.1 Peptidase family U32 [Moorella glycerini]